MKMMEYFSRYKPYYEEIYKEFKRYFPECDVPFEELLIYVTAPSDTGDKISPEQILQNRYYLYHELVEICYLKKWGVRIDKYTILMNPGRCYEAHYHAIEAELEFAEREGDSDWIEKRLKHVEEYLKDERTPSELKGRFEGLIRKFGKR